VGSVLPCAPTMATTMGAPAAAAEGAAVPDAHGLSQAAALVLRALQCSGNASAAERYGKEFRRWAQEGRPYRGQVFSTADVDAALAAYKRFVHLKVQEVQAEFQKSRVKSEEGQAEGKKPQSTVRLCTVKAAKDFPCPTRDVVDASQEIAQCLGPQPRQISADVNLLPALHELASGAGVAAGDVRVCAADGLVYAHCKILSAASRVLQCKFDGRFNSSNRDVDAGAFRQSVVQAAVSFIYLGICQVPREEIHTLFALADLWQVSELMAAVLAVVSEMPPIVCVKELAEWEDDGSGGLARFSAALVQRAAWGFNHCAESLRPLPRTSPVLGQAPRRVDDEDGWAKESRKLFAELAEANAPVWLFVRDLCKELEKLPAASLARLRSTWVTSGDDANELREGQEDGDDDVGEINSQPLARALEKFFTAALPTGRREELRLLATLRLRILPHFNALRVVRNVAAAGGIVDESGAVWPWAYWTHASGLNFTQLWSYYNMLRRCPRRPTMPQVGPATDFPDLLGGGGGNTDGDPLPEDLEKEFAMAFAGSLEHDSEAALRWESLLVEDPHGIRWPALDESLHLLARFIQGSPARLAGLPPTAALRVLRIAMAALPSAAVQLSGAEAQANKLGGLYCATKSSTAASSSHSGKSVKRWRREGVAASPALELRKVPRAPQDLWAVDREDLATTGLRFAWKGVPDEVLRTARTEWKIQPAEDDPYVDIPQALAFDEVQDPANISGPWWIFNSKLQKFSCRHGIVLSREAVDPAAAAPFVPALRAWAKHRAGCGAAREAILSHFKELETCLARADSGSQCQVLLQLCHSAAVSVKNEAREAPKAPSPEKPRATEAAEAGEPAAEQQQVQGLHQGSTAEATATPDDSKAAAAPSVKDVQNYTCPPAGPPPAAQVPPQAQPSPVVQKAATAQPSLAVQSAREVQSQAGTKPPLAREEPPVKVRPRLLEEPPAKAQRTDAGPPQRDRQAAQRQHAHEAWARAFEVSQKAHEEERAQYRRWREASEAARRAREAEETARQALDALGGA